MRAKTRVGFLISGLWLVFGCIPVLNSQTPWDGLQQLIGAWKRDDKPAFETWESESATVLRGEGYRHPVGGEKRVTEYLRLVKKEDGSIAYQATVPDQNNGATVDFPLTFFTPDSWTFENAEHDFPQKIEYRLSEGGVLKVTVSSVSDPGYVLWFHKTKEPAPPKSLAGYDLFVSSRNTGTVKHFDAFTGRYLGEFGKEQLIDETQDVAIGPDGKLYVTSRKATHILKFDPATGAFLGEFSSGYLLNNPTKLSFGPDGYVYVSQWGENQSAVVRFDAHTGVFDRRLTENLAGPLGHAWDANGNLYVACFYSKDVRKYNLAGEAVGAVTPPDSLKGPSNLWFGADGDLFVADWVEGRIKRFRSEAGPFPFQGIFADGFARLEGLTLGPDGYLYACDWHLNLIKKLDAATGDQIGVYIEGEGMVHPNGLVFWKKGN